MIPAVDILRAVECMNRILTIDDQLIQDSSERPRITCHGLLRVSQMQGCNSEKVSFFCPDERVCLVSSTLEWTIT